MLKIKSSMSTRALASKRVREKRKTGSTNTLKKPFQEFKSLLEFIRSSKSITVNNGQIPLIEDSSNR